MTLEQRIESACEQLPEGWRIRIDIEKHSGTVTAIRPDDTEVPMGDGESDLEEQVRDAGLLARDEIAADKLSLENDQAEASGARGRPIANPDAPAALPPAHG
jgi:hypothetical protein